MEASIFTTVLESYVASFGVECEIVLLEDNPAVMQAIGDGTVDAVVGIYSLGIELSKKHPVGVTAVSFSPLALSFAVPKGKNSDVIADIDRLTAPMVKDSDSLCSPSFDKWTIPDASTSIPVWIWWGLGGLGLFGVLLGQRAG